jgi:hypothetical protein
VIAVSFELRLHLYHVFSQIYTKDGTINMLNVTGRRLRNLINCRGKSCSHMKQN